MGRRASARIALALLAFVGGARDGFAAPSGSPPSSASGAAPAGDAAPAPSAADATNSANADPTKLSNAPEPAFMDAFPKLKDYRYEEPPTGFYMGFGVSPIGVVKDRTMFSANFLQVHWMNRWLDYEILNATFASTRASSAEYQSTSFTFRTSLKYKISNWFSAGALVGYEFVSFPNLKAVLTNNPYKTYEEPFSSRGPIYGAIATETFKWKDTPYVIQLNEVGYQESYSTSSTADGWDYNFGASPVQADRTLIQASLVFAIEAAFLF